MRFVTVAAVLACAFVQLTAATPAFWRPNPPLSPKAPECQPHTSAAPAPSQTSKYSTWGPDSITCAQACQVNGNLKPLPSNCLWSCENCHTQFWDWVCKWKAGLCEVTNYPELPPRAERVNRIVTSVDDGSITPSTTLLSSSNGGPSPVITTLPTSSRSTKDDNQPDAVASDDMEDTVSDDAVKVGMLDISNDVSTPNIFILDHDSISPLNTTLPDLVSRAAVSSLDIQRCYETCGSQCASTFFCDDLVVCAQHCLSNSRRFSSSWSLCKKDPAFHSWSCSTVMSFNQVLAEVNPSTATKCKMPAYHPRLDQGELAPKDCKKHRRSLDSEAVSDNELQGRNLHQMASREAVAAFPPVTNNPVSPRPNFPVAPDCRPHTSLVVDPTPTSTHPNWGPGSVTCKQACALYEYTLADTPVDCMWSCTNCNAQFWKFICVLYQPVCDVTDWPVLVPPKKPPGLRRQPTSTKSASLVAATALEQSPTDAASAPLTTTMPKPGPVTAEEENETDETDAGQAVEKRNAQLLPNPDLGNPDLKKTILDLTNATSPALLSRGTVSANDLHLCAEACGSDCASTLFCNNQILCAQYCLTDAKKFTGYWRFCRDDWRRWVRVCDLMIRYRKRTLIAIGVHSDAKCKKPEYPPVWKGKKVPGWAEVDCEAEDMPKD